MTWTQKVRIDKADALFSRFIRLRDKFCVRCGKSGTGEEGIIGLQCSHFWGRGHESVRFDPLNADALCLGCHMRWEKEKAGEYRDFKVRQLGRRRFDALEVRARSFVKKDRKLSLLIVKALLKMLDVDSKVIGGKA